MLVSELIDILKSFPQDYCDSSGVSMGEHTVLL